MDKFICKNNPINLKCTTIQQKKQLFPPKLCYFKYIPCEITPKKIFSSPNVAAVKLYKIGCQLIKGYKNGAEKDFENSAPNPYYYPNKTLA